MLDRHVSHIGVDLDAGHQAARKAEPARHGIVVDLVFRSDRGVAGRYPIGRQGGFAHETLSVSYSAPTVCTSMRNASFTKRSIISSVLGG